MTMLAEQVCLMTGAPPTDNNVSDAQQAIATNPLPQLSSLLSARPDVDEINCLLSGMPPTAANLAHCEAHRTQAAATTAHSSFFDVQTMDEVNCLLSGMPPTTQNTALAGAARETPSTWSPMAGLSGSFGSVLPNSLSKPASTAARSISVRRVATMLGPM
ncbi:hypothetical protein DIPPA_21730 [Diplonema papillatum]|nr:hypothetical protein DIPPA_21730 [Diplonema papillatum]